MYLFLAPLVSNTCEAPTQNELCTAMLAKTGHLLTPSDPVLHHDSIVVTWTLLTPTHQPESSICIAQQAVLNSVSCSGLSGRLPSACPLKSWPHKADFFCRVVDYYLKWTAGRESMYTCTGRCKSEIDKASQPNKHLCMPVYVHIERAICQVALCPVRSSSVMARPSLEMVIVYVRCATRRLVTCLSK